MIEPENAEALVECNSITGQRIAEVARELGQKGREYIVRKFSRARPRKNIFAVLERMLNLPERREHRTSPP